MRFVISLPLFAGGALVSLYGVFGLLYRGENGGSTYVLLMGRSVDAHLFGAVCLLFGLTAIAAGVALVRRGRIRT